MRVLSVSHPACARHDAGRNHPERPARLEAALAGAEAAPVETISAEAPLASRKILELVHDPAYIEGMERLCAAGGGRLDPDTRAGEESWEAALRAAGAGPEAVRRLQAGEAEAAFLAVRPPDITPAPLRPWVSACSTTRRLPRPCWPAGEAGWPS